MIHNGVVKLADFGAAKLWYQCGDKQNVDSSMSGSPCYLAPEVITNTQELGPKGARDIWALGCFLYEMVLGKEPWHELDNIWSLYYIMGLWAKRARDFKSETRDDEPFQMLRGCRVCDAQDSDEAREFSFDDSDVSNQSSHKSLDKSDEQSAEELCSVPIPFQYRGKVGHHDHESVEAPCGIMDVNCIASATHISNPLVTNAVKSGMFSEEALDFLNLTLQWTPENRPTGDELLRHPYIRNKI